MYKVVDGEQKFGDLLKFGHSEDDIAWAYVEGKVYDTDNYGGHSYLFGRTTDIIPEQVKDQPAITGRFRPKTKELSIYTCEYGKGGENKLDSKSVYALKKLSSHYEFETVYVF